MDFRPFHLQSAEELRAEWVFWNKQAAAYANGSSAHRNCVYFAKRCQAFLRKVSPR
jgi:hypothetical protein